MKIEMERAIESQVPIWEVAYYDRRETYSGYRKSEHYTSMEEARQRVEEMKLYNASLFEKMLAVFRDYGITSDNHDNYTIWNSLLRDKRFEAYKNTLSGDELFIAKRCFRYDKDAVGYCFINMGMRIEHVCGYDGVVENTIGFVGERERLDIGIKVYSIETSQCQSEQTFWLAIYDGCSKTMDELVRSVLWSDDWCDFDEDDISYTFSEVDMNNHYKPMYVYSIEGIDGYYEYYSNIPSAINDLIHKDWQEVGRFRMMNVRIGIDKRIQVYTYKD